MFTYTEYQYLETKPIWVVYRNTDLTEGRGAELPVHSCAYPETALRLAKGTGVMGSNCDVKEEVALRHNGSWYVPGAIIPESEQDKNLRVKRESEEVKTKARDAVIEKAKAHLTEDEIKILRGEE